MPVPRREVPVVHRQHRARASTTASAAGRPGDVITFVREIEHLDFTDAVERLASRASIELRYDEGGSRPGSTAASGTAARRPRRGRRVLRRAAAHPPEARSAGVPAGARLRRRRRGRTFGVGYAPDGWDITLKHLRGKGFTDAELLAGGLASQGQRGPIDRFRGRLLWPIRDLTGDVIGFGARRLLDDDKGPKYLNTPETPLYKKSQVLYGVDLAKHEIATKRKAVVVEGYTDVMACHLAGVTTAVATCGTAFGEEHIEVLRRLLMDQDALAGEVIFTFDGDAAGRKAALKAFTGEQKFVTQTFVAIEPDGLDPCELRQQRGDLAVRDLVARRIPLVEFVIRATLERLRPRHPRGPGRRRWPRPRRSSRAQGLGRCATSTPAGWPAGWGWMSPRCCPGSGAASRVARPSARRSVGVPIRRSTARIRAIPA